MFQIEAIFTSAAKVRVLETLHHHRTPLALRHIEYLTGLQIRSVQRAVEQLCQEERLLFEKKKAAYVINRQHADYDLLADIFEAVQKHQLRQRAAGYHATAQRALLFCNEANELFCNLDR